MDERVRNLLERDEVVAAVTELFLRTDERDWVAVRACFAERVVFDMTSLTGGAAVALTPREITDGWEQGLRPISALHHQVGNFRVEVGRGEADASCYGVAWHYRPNRSGQATRTFVGSYNFHLRHGGGAWKIDAFRFNCKFVDGNLDLEKDD